MILIISFAKASYSSHFRLYMKDLVAVRPQTSEDPADAEAAIFSISSISPMPCRKS